MGKIEKLLDKTIEDKGDFWKIVIVMVVVATLLVSLASFGFRSCTSALVSQTWSTPDEASVTSVSEDQ